MLSHARFYISLNDEDLIYYEKYWSKPPSICRFSWNCIDPSWRQYWFNVAIVQGLDNAYLAFRKEQFPNGGFIFRIQVGKRLTNNFLWGNPTWTPSFLIDNLVLNYTCAFPNEQVPDID